MFRLLALIYISTFSIASFSQTFNLGLPFIQSFPKESYQAAAQNWDVAQDGRGVMYFANANGLLTYDARLWKIYPLPNKSILRSIELSDDGQIYAGGQNEFGVFSPNSVGDWEFQSLKHLIPPEHRSFDDVWDLVCTKKGVFFRSSGKLFHLEQDTCFVYDNKSLSFLGESQGEIFVQDIGGRTLKFEQGAFLEFSGLQVPEGDYLTGICRLDGRLLFSSLKHGFYELDDGVVKKWSTSFDVQFREQEIRSVQEINASRLAIGTSFGGLIFLEKNNKISLQIRKQEGLLRDRVLSLYKDHSQNLWLGLDNGINHVSYNSPFSRIYPDGLFQGTGYDVKVLGDQIYFGTSNGLYYTKWKSFYNPEEKSMKFVEGSKGQVWGLDVIDDQLLIAHNKGGFILESRLNRKAAREFSVEKGTWAFGKLKHNSTIIYAGTYDGLSFFERTGDTYKLLFNLPQFKESSRFVEQDDRKNLWISHPYRGIYRIELKPELKQSVIHQYGKADGLPSDLENHLFRIKNEILFCGETGIFLYNYEKDQFEPYEVFEKVLGANIKVRRLAEVPNGDIWFITQSDFGVLRLKDRGLDKVISKDYFPEIEAQLNKGYEKIEGIGDQHVFITTEEGFFHYDYGIEVTSDTFFQAVIREVILTGFSDSLAFAGLLPIAQNSLSKERDRHVPTFSHQENAFRFGFSATDYTSGKYIQYRTKLEGFEESWSAWTQLANKEYTNLSPGTYSFRLQARNKQGIISKVETYAFNIEAPWFANSIAYTCYFLLFLGSFIGLFGFQRKKIVNLQEDQEKIIEESEKTIGQLKAEKIQTELSYKQRELVAATMHLVQKKEMLETVKSGLKEIRKKSDDDQVNKQIQNLLSMLHQDAVFDDGWQQFLAHFNEMNEGLFNRLKNKYPNLTPKDLKLCAYLRMNLSTKEMAALQNVTVRGIEASRYRLRKKFNISPETNLTEFLMAF